MANPSHTDTLDPIQYLNGLERQGDTPESPLHAEFTGIYDPRVHERVRNYGGLYDPRIMAFSVLHFVSALVDRDLFGVNGIRIPNASPFYPSQTPRTHQGVSLMTWLGAVNNVAPKLTTPETVTYALSQLTEPGYKVRSIYELAYASAGVLYRYVSWHSKHSTHSINPDQPILPIIGAYVADAEYGIPIAAAVNIEMLAQHGPNGKLLALTHDLSEFGFALMQEFLNKSHIKDIGLTMRNIKRRPGMTDWLLGRIFERDAIHMEEMSHIYWFINVLSRLTPAIAIPSVLMFPVDDLKSKGFKPGIPATLVGTDGKVLIH